MVIGRHVLVADLVDDVPEEAVFFEGVVQGVEVVEDDIAFLFIFAVTGDAVFLEERPGLRDEIVGPSRRERESEEGNGSKKVHRKDSVC